MPIPTLRSFSQILGNMLGTFRARTGLSAVQAGDPSVSILEAAAQSDFRNTQESLRALAWQNLDNRERSDLDATGAAEGVRRQSARAATGRVTISDSAFTKIASTVAVGAVAGTTVVQVVDGSGFPASGSVYLGRTNGSEEGPIAFTRSGNLLTLSTATGNYHQIGDSVILAQGGARTIPAKAVVTTNPNVAGGQVSFQLVSSAVLPDGEVSTSALVECQTPGVSGNVGAGEIVAFASLPFPTATVTNPLRFVDGRATENDDSYREAIRLAMRSRAKATETAVVSAILGAEADDEPSRVSTASVTNVFGSKAVVIDDGTGYQPKDAGIAYEVLTGSALGGENFFALENRPVALAYVKSTVTTWVPQTGTSLTVYVGGEPSTHQFLVEDFFSTTSATAEEIVASINRNHTLKFAARMVGDSFAIFAKSTTNEDLQVSPGGANEWLFLPTSRVYTLRLYRNGRLLTKDGRVAAVESSDHGSWLSISSGATLSLTVDGISIATTIVDADFVSSNTGFTTVSQLNSVSSWATVLNRKLPGVTVSEVEGRLRFQSNRGASDAASISVVGGTLATAMFAVLPVSASGLTSDYSFDATLAHIQLTQELEAGDVLTAGTLDTRAFVEALSASPTLASSAELWFSTDGQTTFPEAPVGVGSNVGFSVASSPSWGQRIQVSSVNAFMNAQNEDWIVLTDSAIPTNLRGAFRIAQVLSASNVHIERPAATLAGPANYILSDGGFFLVRSTTPLQKVTVGAGSYTASALASAISVDGATASVTNGKARVSTNRPDGTIAVVAGNAAGLALFGREIAASESPHVGVVVSSRKDTGIPSFTETSVTVGGTSSFTTATNADSYLEAVFLRSNRDAASSNRSSNLNSKTTVINGSTALSVAPSAVSEWLPGNRLYFTRGFDLTARDTLSVVVDNDSVAGTYSVPMARQTSVASYGGTWELEETNGDSLAKTFGTGFDWTGFGVSFRSRTKTHASPDTNKTVLWRWWRHGPEGDEARIQYQYPQAALSGISVDSTNVNDIVVRLQGGAARSVPTIRPTSFIGMAIPTLASSLYTYQFVASLAVSGANRVLRLNYSSRNSTAFTGTVTGAISGATATVVSDSNAGGSPAASGVLVVTAVSGTFAGNETLTAGAASATSASGVYGYTTLTLTLPGAITNHGIAANTAIYFTPGDANFLPGTKLVAAATATTVSYIDSVATAASAAAIGSVSVDSAGEVTLSGTSVVTGDIASGASTSWPSLYQKPLKITVAAGGRSWTGQHFEGPTPPSTTLTWVSASGIQFFPLVANTASQIATAVNALTNSPVSAVAVGTSGPASATGVVSDASYESTELGGANPWWNFSDGFNWVRSTTIPPTTNDNFVFTLRNAIATPLTTNADISAESVYLVPATASAVGRWLNSQVSGLGVCGSGFELRDGTVCVQTDTLGSAGSIFVSGGSANSTGTSVRGMANNTGLGITAVVDNADGLGGLQWVWVQNAVGHNKTVFNSATALSSLSADGTVVLDNTVPTGKAWTRIGSLVDNALVYIEKQGDLVALRSLTVAGVSEGDFIRLDVSTNPVSGTTPLEARNAGIFTVLRVTGTTVWIENSQVVEQLAGVKYDFIAHDSVIPGDTVVFGSTAWGDNVGARTVKSLGATEWQFVLDTSQPLTPYSGSPIALGSNSASFRVVATPARLLKQIVGIGPNGTQMSVFLTSTALARVVTEGLGTSLIVAGKLGFEVGTKAGNDGYRHNTGLVAKVSQILVGDERDRLSYPGVAAAGTSYHIQGPLVKRVQVALSCQATEHTDSMRQQIQSAVAGVINATPVGQSVAVSKLVAAAQSVNGVLAVSVLSPNPSQKFISVQPYEKALVNSLDGNITINFEGE